MDSTCNGSFEKKSSVSSGEIPKFPIQRLEPAIQKFVKVIEIDLDRLHKHRLNIEKVWYVIMFIQFDLHPKLTPTNRIQVGTVL